MVRGGVLMAVSVTVVGAHSIFMELSKFLVSLCVKKI
jgi:hypothetical protein